MYMYWDRASIICVWNIGQIPCTCTVMEPEPFVWNIKQMACTVMEPAPSACGILDKFHEHVLWWSQNHLCGILNQWHVLWCSQHHLRVEYWTIAMHLYCDKVSTICVWKTGIYMYCDGASTICRWNIEPMACTVMEPAPSAGRILEQNCEEGSQPRIVKASFSECLQFAEGWEEKS
jgi:hypothetical protein